MNFQNGGAGYRSRYLPSNYLTQEQLRLEDRGNADNHIRLFTDGSKTQNGVGAAFCVMEDGMLTHRWSTKPRDENTVFQAELLALKEAIQYATYITSHQPIKILTDNKASIQASTNPKTPMQQLDNSSSRPSWTTLK
ncbi:hypothetical protein AVEN_261417-1 [Araneus ventricosus]|uniref:RNase H type-1 domain-containing protein n=1 Tax=Araneus ventricosus TaxID=182803 RepID=A0A4Y2VP75_ARAVE|nr:hypothetical protein AVEN_261417-1 [Araneus ventricosus]